MKRIISACVAAMTALFLIQPAANAAPTALDILAPVAPAAGYALDTVLVVHNWVLCVTQPSAETMARAQEESLEAAQKAYDALVRAKTCGRLAKLDVLLHKQLYPVVHVEQATRVFAASINFGKVGWQDAFLVSSVSADSQ